MTDIGTASGGYLDFMNPHPDMIQIEDIAAGLTCCSRYSGQMKKEFRYVGGYSVAQHSILMASWALKYAVGGDFEKSNLIAREALLHDATEAYIGDMVSPLKRECKDYREIEGWLDGVIRVKYGLPRKMSPEVRELDMMALATELRDVMGENTAKSWPKTLPEPDPIIIGVMEPRAVYAKFMQMYWALYGLTK